VLLFACTVDHLELLKRALAAGVDPNAADPMGEPALMKAAAFEHHPLVRCLIDAGANVDTRDAALGATALVIVAARGDTTVVDLLLRAGADVDAVARGLEMNGVLHLPGETALIAAAGRGHADVVERLLAAGADARKSRSDGLGAAQVALDAGHQTISVRLHRASARTLSPVCLYAL